MDREDVKMLIKKWWDIYNDESLDFKPKSPEDLEETLSKSTSIASVTEPPVSNSPAASSAAWEVLYTGTQDLEWIEAIYIKLICMIDYIILIKVEHVHVWCLVFFSVWTVCVC